MAGKPWSTKEEVLKDLAKVYGRRTRSIEEIDESFLQVGDAPPPSIRENIDFQNQYLFGDEASSMAVSMEEEERIIPDYAGITRMIRDMEEYEDSKYADGMSDDAANDKEYVIAISKVSKLNPNVEAFTPRKKKGLISHSRDLANKDINTNVLKQNVKAIEEAKKAPEVEVKGKETSDKQIAEVTEQIEKKLQVQVKGKESGDHDDLEVGKNEIEDMATTLKNQISNAAKSDLFEFKKQKNVAIATLLRLYSKDTTPPKSETPVKLMTPEYFERKVERRPEVETPVHVATTESSSTPEPRDSSTTLPTCSTLDTSTSSTNLTSPRVKVDPEVKKSIAKVNRWLEEPTPKKPKSPAVCLGPIAFKRKEPVTSPVTSHVSASTSPARKPATHGQQYQPSKYAEDLGQKYLERSKILESKQKEVTWNNLEEVLKAKDLEIRKRQKEKLSTGGSYQDEQPSTSGSYQEQQPSTSGSYQEEQPSTSGSYLEEQPSTSGS